MTPLFGCFPTCFLLTSLGIVGVLMYFTGAGPAGEPDAPPADPEPRPPYWVVPVVLVLTVAVLLLLSLVIDG